MINFYLPVTSQPREFDAKLLLALIAAERGHRAWIGYKSVFQTQLELLEPGVFLAHNARQKLQRQQLTRDYGHRIFVLDEEALVRQTDEIFLKKHPKGAFGPVSKILCWGQDDFDMWVRHGINAEQGRAIVGNLRFDLLRPELASFHEPDVQAIKARFGDYVLLNTNFPTVNNLTSRGGGVRMAPWAMDQHGKELTDGFLANKRAMFQAMLALVAPLAEAIFPLKLLVRPHPNEDHRPWYDAVQGLENAEVVFEGGVVPWLLGATALVHNNCTTAVEAAAAAVPVVNFNPWASEFDNGLSNAFGPVCRTTAEVAAALEAIRNSGGQRLPEERWDLLRRHVQSIDGPLSGDLIVSLAEETVSGGGAAGLERPSRNRRAVSEMQALRLWRLLKLYRTRNGWRTRRYVERTYPELRLYRLDHEQLNYTCEQFDLLMRQFPPLNLKDITEKIDRFAAACGRFAGLKPVLLSQQLMRIG